ncbi:MAG: ABC transporter permease [Thermoanaerobaculia bacterium]
MLEDLRHAVRSLLRDRSFSLAVILTLALGIGSNVALFSTLYGVLLRPLPYPEPERLGLVWAQWPKKNLPKVSHPGGDVLEYRKSSHSFEQIAAVAALRQNLTGGDHPEQVQVGWVSRNFLTLFKTPPSLGRDFRPDEPANSVILSHAFWQRYFGGSEAVLGRSVSLDGQPFTVIGVLPPGFRLVLPKDIGISAAFDALKPADEVGSPSRWVSPSLELSTLRVLARLKPGFSFEQARADLAAVAARLRERFPDHAEVGFALDLEPLHAEVVSSAKRVLWFLQAAVVLVLLVASFNAANLLTVRATHRSKELALRAAIGGSLYRLGRQMAAESLVLGALGGLLGLALAWGGVRLLLFLKPASLPLLTSVAIDRPVLGFAVATALVATLLAGVAPVARALSPDLGEVLKEKASSVQGRFARNLSRALVVFQVALSVLLLLGAGLLGRSLTKLLSIRPGFEPARLLTFAISMPATRYSAPAGTEEFQRRLAAALGALPGVRSVGSVWPLPLEGQNWYGGYQTDTHPAGSGPQQLCDFRMVTPAYLDTVGARLVEGRQLWADDHDAVLVDQRFAEANWPGQSALGRRFQAAPNGTMVDMQVVGVVENIRLGDLKADGRETLYLPAKKWSWNDFELYFVARTEGDPLALAQSAREALAKLDPEIPMAKVRAMDDYVADATGDNRFALVALSIFALLALALAAIGLYGLLSYTVSRETREIGIRLALGAQRRSILRRTVRQGAGLALLGTVLGLATSLLAARSVSGLLFGVSTGDLPSYAGAVVVLFAVALAASYLPARRAVRLDPLDALNHE